MKYIIICNSHMENWYFAADPDRRIAGKTYRDTILEAVTDLHNSSCIPEHPIFSYLHMTDSGEYYLSGRNDKIHSIINSEINPELFI